ncbi:TIGR04283 family arsenosugar biosynthesis glycosyltransferase [Pseudomonas sp. N040]|uniref:TIGR04283 family arsenosugar biosynthesis glycosyltransferase n=1 Tax=Pseudomonas sp. N040 TaxID=2785325 RepID=UPI0018A26709|nr:TIGR04283 family arsenosugar biosynthesis glycosyltransferase [Pseudomonas sp. N040]MBF7729165.1 TIGR04283 family arsenosugar biosynthesis glycosyltransferase [Pseudomonas sp. N040]MBW7012805.1 TIGR04283 family arsenosugar biosynthesis glycosyltransferase [Pseudomonas sp. N040]
MPDTPANLRISAPPISLVIPCYRDEASLARLLAQLRQLPASSAQELQIIVVDAARNPACQQLCGQYAAQWLGAQPCRGEQLRLGAAQAQHALLWFLHADAQLQGDPLVQLRAALAGGAVAGYFDFRFAGPGCWQGRLLERLTNWRTRFGIPYGDQGLFATRTAYFGSGQHSPWPLFEEVELVRQLRRHGRLVRLAQGLQVDPRRWQRDGWWRRSLRNRLLAAAFMLGVPASRLAHWYTPRKPAARPADR